MFALHNYYYAVGISQFSVKALVSLFCSYYARFVVQLLLVSWQKAVLCDQNPVCVCMCVRACVCVRPFELLTWFTDFHANWYDNCPFVVRPKAKHS
jgi:hypothetical protein